MTARTRAHSRFVLALGLALLAPFAGACDQMGAAPKKEAKVADTACADYSKKVCDAAGAESATCTGMKAATELMPKAACGAALTEFAFTEKKLGEAKKSCDELTTKLCAEIGDKTETCPPERCTMMMEHFAEVAADLKKREAKNQPLSPEKIAAIAKSDAPAFGPEGSKVTLVEFSDFQCPFCSRAATVVHQVKEKYGDKVRFVFRQFPLSFHQNAQMAAEAALAANEQGKFWELHDKMFADQAKLDRASLEATAKGIGLDMAAFKKALDDKAHAATIAADTKLGEEVGVDGTPTVFINGKRVADPTNFEALSKQIEAALAEG